MKISLNLGALLCFFSTRGFKEGDVKNLGELKKGKSRGGILRSRGGIGPTTLTRKVSRGNLSLRKISNITTHNRT